LAYFRLKNQLSKNYIIELLKKKFKDKESFSRKDLYDFYLQFEPELKETTFRWRIYNLKGKKIIRPISRTEFTLAYKPAYKPFLEDSELKLFATVEKEFKPLKKAVWSTRIISEFMLHQSGRFFTLIEAEKDAIEPVFHLLLDNNVKNVFLQPEEKELQRYISELNNAIVVQPLVSKAPLQKIQKASTVTIEKLLVDLFADKKLYHAYQGSELVFIFNRAYQKYAIDFTKLFSYAQRRRRETELMEFISTKTDIPNTILND
jgi:hypothetical protein